MKRLKRGTGPPTSEQMLLVEALYERHKGLFYKIALERARDETEAGDLISEGLLRLFRNADSLRGLADKQAVDYIADTMRSVAGDYERKHRAENRHFISLDDEDRDIGAISPDPAEELEEREEQDRRLSLLREALTELGETDRLLLTGKYLHGESDEALAARLGVKPSSVRMKLTRARKRAREIMERKEAGERDRKKLKAQ